MTDPTANEPPDLSELAGTADPERDAGEGELTATEKGPAGETPTSGPEMEIARLREELRELGDRHVRLVAEFANFRRREAEERTGTWDRAQADLVGRFLDVLDDLQRVSLLDPEEEAVTVQSIVEGIDLVERKFHRALEDAGCEVLDPEEGSPFDPERMEAMMRVSVDEAERDDTVAHVIQRGYLFRGHLVRPARVSVHKVD